MNIILSRTDSLGDVVLTLPMAGVLKEHFPGCKILFLGRKYSRPLIEACSHVDQFLDWDDFSGAPDRQSAVDKMKSLKADAILHVFPVKEICRLASEARIPVRISTSHRFYTWLWCNRRVHFSRKNSHLHEAQLNLKLLSPLGINGEMAKSELAKLFALDRMSKDLPGEVSSLVASDKFNLILHPRSKGSAREWGLDNYSALIRLLDPGKYRIFVTGTREEGDQMKPFLAANSDRINDLTGKLSLSELMAFIKRCDGLVAASTGPLHIAAALGIKAIGLYAPMRPIFPERWAPLGEKADWLVLEKECQKCRHTEDCECIRSIRPEEVVKKIET